jgi:hypothetical protein
MVMGPKWVPDTKTERPTDVGHNINSTQVTGDLIECALSCFLD